MEIFSSASILSRQNSDKVIINPIKKRIIPMKKQNISNSHICSPKDFNTCTFPSCGRSVGQRPRRYIKSIHIDQRHKRVFTSHTSTAAYHKEYFFHAPQLLYKIISQSYVKSFSGRLLSTDSIDIKYKDFNSQCFKRKKQFK